MGPPELPGGNYHIVGEVGATLVVLQWGRRNYPAETVATEVLLGLLQVLLQWGRRNYPAETTDFSFCEITILSFNGAAGITRRKQPPRRPLGGGDLPASMGPPELPGGNHYRPVLNRRARHASMGPPELPGGNSRPGVPSVVATCPLQWGRRNYPAETTIDRSSTVARATLQWGRRNYPAETRVAVTLLGQGSNRFNGAAGITRRKPRLSSCWQTRGYRLQWGRRNYPAETHTCGTSRRAWSPGFNGAAGITRRKRTNETGPFWEPKGASMGPPELPGGNSWPNAQHLPEPCSSFNGAAGITRRKRAEGPAVLFADCRASMGPPELPGGNSTGN